MNKLGGGNDIVAKMMLLSAHEEVLNLADSIKTSFHLEIESVMVNSETVISVVKQAMDNGIDAIITRGSEANEIRKAGITIPIVEVYNTDRDLIDYFLKAKEESELKDPAIAMISFHEVGEGTHYLCDLLGIKFKKYALTSTEDVEPMLDKAILEGAQIIIGGHKIYIHGKAKGIHVFNMLVGESSMRHALSLAEKIGYAIDMEKKKNQERNTILGFSSELMIGIDMAGRINFFNPSAQRAFKIKEEEVKGKKLTEVIRVIDNATIQEVLIEGAEVLSKLIEFEDTAYVFNFIPVVFEGKIEGGILSFQEYKKLELVESDIRSQLYLKGHVARYRFQNMIGKSKDIIEAKRIAMQFAKHDSTVLINGESGTGKELFAQSIHNESLRKYKPFVTINCASIPDNLIESELFGYVEGAFTGAAKKGKRGLFDLAHTGTVFLDEISELNLTSQQKFLRVLQERSIMRIGDNKVMPVDVRIIAASNRNLRTMIQKGDFRADLFHRINILSFTIPPLRQRKEDIAVLFQYFIDDFSKKTAKYFTISDKVFEVIRNYSWPGNVRELKNFCERLVIISSSKNISAEYIQEQLENDFYFSTENQEGLNGVTVENKIYGDKWENAGEESKIRKLLEKCNGNRIMTAQLLGISKTTLWRKMKQYNIQEKYN